MNARQVFDPIFCCTDHREPSEEFLRSENKRLIEMLADDDTGKHILTFVEWKCVVRDLEGVHLALRTLAQKPGRCLECGHFGQLKNGICINCR